jgi:methylmalonyl-CoA mutase N-terminal domain/subunit
MKITTDVIEFCAREMPKWNPISISGYHIREAGSTAVQEVAFTLAHGLAYVEAALARGLAIDEFAPRLSFFFNAHNHFLEEVAKFRAARRLWARITRDRLGCRDPRAQMLRFHAQTAGSALTAQQPENNVVRVALQALAAVLGGAQSLHTNAMDEALALPTERAATIALRTQQVLAHESGAADVVDPLGGAYYVEAQTARIESLASALIERIDALGGAVAAVERGFVQREIQESAYRHQQEIERGERIVVGVNRYREDEAPGVTRHRIDPALEREQVERLRAFRARRDEVAARAGGAAPHAAALDRIERAARAGDPLVPFILDAVEARATLGEISDALRRALGTYRQTA